MSRTLRYLLFLFSFFLITVSFGQDASLADSLKKIYSQDENRKSDIELLTSIANHEISPDSTIKYVELVINSTKSDSVLIEANLMKADALRLKGDYNAALNSGFDAMSIAQKLEDEEKIGMLNIVIANIYSENQDRNNASRYFKKGIAHLRKSNDSISLGKALFNAGDNYLQIEQLDSALMYTKESELIFHQLSKEHYKAYSYGNLGYIYFKRGVLDSATVKIEQAIAILETIGDETPIPEYLLYLSDIKMNEGDYDLAFELAGKSLKMAQKLGLKKEISQANLKLSQIADFQKDHESSLLYYKNHVALRDSIHNLESVQEMADLRTDFEVSQKQLEVDLLNNQKRTQRIIMYSLGFVLLLTAIYYRRLVKEKNRSDLLLLNILPSKTAKELKEKGKVEARKFEAVTVMFTDFEAFTRYSQNLSPEKLVKSVDHYFSAFDKIIEKHGLEKIKTIGDAYMCTGGLISKGPMQPVKVINAAFEILEFIKKESKSDDDEIAHFDIRIGINTGPVVAGVVGTKKFAYDIWGDSVNVAARMESNSKAGKINISENTYAFVKDRFECEYRGEIDVKNKGMMKMYFVLKPKSTLNSNETEAIVKHEASSAPHTP